MATWKRAKVTKDIDVLPDGTELIHVTLPAVKGMKASDRDALFMFERRILGLGRAMIRMNKRANGVDLGDVPYKISVAEIPADLERFYA